MLGRIFTRDQVGVFENSGLSIFRPDLACPIRPESLATFVLAHFAAAPGARQCHRELFHRPKDPPPQIDTWPTRILPISRMSGGVSSMSIRPVY